MDDYTIILTTPKVEIPKTKIIEFVKNLFSSNSINVDYFGVELDNPEDYIDEDLVIKNDNSININIYFEQEAIDYEEYNDEKVLKLALNLLETKNIGQTIVVENEIEIYVN